jgi:OmpA-OmpF porin, OOP family
MKKNLIMLTMIITLGVGVSQSQTPTKSWALGFGLSNPRYLSVNVDAINSSLGTYIAIQRNFSEHVGLRLKGAYSHLEGRWYDASFNRITQTTNLITGDLDLQYYLVPCAPVSPYLFAGAGGNYKNIANSQTGVPHKFGNQFNVGAGAEFKVFPNWSFVTEFGYHVTNNSELEGTVVPDELNGRDSYLTIAAGMNFVFGKGEPSKQCEPCQMISQEAKDLTDYNKIDAMIVKHIPKEVLVDRYIMSISNDRLVLIGVNFAFDSSALLPESYPVLDKAVKLLRDRPEVNVEIEGYTDYIGTGIYNQELSVERAQNVQMYLISKGIASNRLTTVGYGKNNPVEDNATEEGRAMNRRIVFKIIK